MHTALSEFEWLARSSPLGLVIFKNCFVSWSCFFFRLLSHSLLEQGIKDSLDLGGKRSIERRTSRTQLSGPAIRKHKRGQPAAHTPNTQEQSDKSWGERKRMKRELEKKNLCVKEEEEDRRESRVFFFFFFCFEYIKILNSRGLFFPPARILNRCGCRCRGKGRNSKL